jgi:transcriptional regulator with PAS, ATPase and Fis domain
VKVAAKVRQERKPCSLSCLIGGRQAALTGTPVFDENGAVMRIVTNVRDLSELSALRQELEEVNRLKEMYFSELSRLKAAVASTSGTFRSAAMQRVYDLALRVAAADTPVLITGESGVGKEVLADYLHANSTRRNGPFIKINCAAIPRRCWSRSCSVMRRGRLPAPSAAASRGCSRSPTAARCSWTRSANCLAASRPSCSASSRTKSF